MTQPLKAHVQNGRLVLDEPTDLPDGEIVELVPVDEVLANGGDYLDAEERAALHAELEASLAEAKAGKLIDADEVLAELRAMPARSQITRHDCVEGWSAIGKWTGVPLSHLLGQAGLKPEARYIVFRCADTFRGTLYYESIDLVDALHPQTILAYGMNDGPLPVGHGAPIRLRVERQLGYKHAKFIMQIEAVDSLAPIGRGKGGFWEDLIDYDWYAGI